jgi:CMP-N,N'-diacetyllegionaminic acid synthase
VIPARGGSKGLPRKNVRELDGLPLIARPVLAAKATPEIDVVVVTTDDEEIAAAARAAGAEVPFLRPPTLAEDLTTTEATLQHALLAYEAHVGSTFDIALFLTATDVFRDPSWPGEAVRRLRADPSLDSVFVGTRTHKNFWQRDDQGEWSRVLPWMREYGSRQTRQWIVREDTGLAGASRAWLWREGRRIGDRVDIIETSASATAIDIHEDEDLFLAEALLRYRRGERWS